MRPSRAIWAAWTSALVGGLAVLVAAVLVLRDPCFERVQCTPSNATAATALAIAGTAISVTAGLVATYLTLRRSETDAG